MYVLPVVTWLLLQFQVCLFSKISATYLLVYSWLFRTGISCAAVVLVSTVGLHSLWSTTMNVNYINAQAGDNIICVLVPAMETGLNLWPVTRPDPTRPRRFSPGDPTDHLVYALWIWIEVLFRRRCASSECFQPKSFRCMQHTLR